MSRVAKAKNKSTNTVVKRVEAPPPAVVQNPRIGVVMAKVQEDLASVTADEWESVKDGVTNGLWRNDGLRLYYALFLRDFLETFHIDPTVTEKQFRLASDEHHVAAAKKFIETWQDAICDGNAFVTPPAYITENLKDEDRGRCLIDYYYGFAYAVAWRKARLLQLSPKSRALLDQIRFPPSA